MIARSINTMGLPIILPKQDKDESKDNYPRQKSYLLERDWEVNQDDGGLTLISEEKKANQGKIVKFVLKKFIQNRSFMGISFPVFAMKPETILETYAKSISAAPHFFENIEADPLQRMKKFVAFTFTFSRLFTDMDKPFNPVLGQTFQAQIAGGSYSAEQTSHHPPQSSFYFEGNGYVVYATIQLSADIGVNSAEGCFMGDIHVKFNDGGHIFGRILSGVMKGFVVGENKFRPHNGSYAYDPVNKVVCTFKREHKDLFTGHIGILKAEKQEKFLKTLRQDEDRFKKFEAFQEKHFESIWSKMEAIWTKSVTFNKKVYIDFNEPATLPFLPTQEGLKLLPSDSSFRKDTKLREKLEIAASQEQKERLQDEQRFFRKLRQKELKDKSSSQRKIRKTSV